MEQQAPVFNDTQFWMVIVAIASLGITLMALIIGAVWKAITKAASFHVEGIQQISEVKTDMAEVKSDMKSHGRQFDKMDREITETRGMIVTLLNKLVGPLAPIDAPEQGDDY